MSAQIGLYTHSKTGNVGIGTTAPCSLLNLTSSGVAADATVLTIGGGGTSCSLGIDFTPQSSRAGGAAAKIRAEGDGSGNAGLSLWTATGGSAASAVERVRIGADGNVGIGTGVPMAKLEVMGNASTHSFEVKGNATLIGAEPTYKGDLRIISNGGTSTLTDGNGGIEFKTSIYQNGYGWRIIAPDTQSVGVPLAFQSRANSSSWSNRVVISQEGYVGIGTTTPQATLHVNGFVRFKVPYYYAAIGPGAANSGAIYYANNIKSNVPSWMIGTYFKPEIPGAYYVSQYCIGGTGAGNVRVQRLNTANFTVVEEYDQSHHNHTDPWDNKGLNAIVPCNGTTDAIRIYVSDGTIFPNLHSALSIFYISD